DADVGLEDDGDYFTWTREELAGPTAGDELELALAHFGVGSEGRMPHAPERNVLFRAAEPAALARQLGRSEAAVAASLAALYRRLGEARARRPAPVVDRTRYAGWNAMLAGALLRAGPLLEDPWCAEAGLAALRRLRAEQAAPDRIAHGPGGPEGLLDDAVQCAAAALDAYEHSGDADWLRWSAALLDQVWERHWDGEAGGLRDRARDAEAGGLLSAPFLPMQDSPNGSSNGVAGQTLARLFEHTREARWRERHTALLTGLGAAAAELGLFASALLLAADWWLRPATHLVITGSAGDPLAEQLHRAALAAFVPRRVVTRLTPASDAAALPPALRALGPLADRPRGYLCAGDRCLAPVDSLAAWSAALRSVLPGPLEGKLHPAPEG
ncbi:MAG TPA: hypothetical protein VL241_01200, partial [Gemmatimonadales bacterium]|nr:hypothetical protein [Gemmatimonadales bacterium]